MNQPLRILHPNFHRGWGGQANRILTLSRKLAAWGHYVVIAAPAGSQLAQRAKAAGIAVFEECRFRRGFHPVIFCRDILALRGLIRREKIDIIHTHGAQDTWVGVMAAKLAGVPIKIVRTRHNIFPVARSLVNRLLYGRWLDWLIVISLGVKEVYIRAGLMDPQSITVIYSAIDLERFRPSLDGSALRAELKIGADTPLVGMVGRLEPEKGYPYFLEAARRVKEKLPSARFVIAGQGSLENSLKEQARELGLFEALTFLGFRPDVPAILAALDVFVLSSLAEGLGTSALEALATAKPVVASSVGGLPESVRHEETGLLVPPKDVEALAEGILRLLNNKAWAQELGQAGRRLMEAEFNEETLAKKTLEVYYKVMSEK